MTGGDGFLLTGLGAAPGRAIGRAQLVLGAMELSTIEPGIIAIARILHPHQAPMFGRIAGVVLEEGSILQHAATLARECGIPCVVALASATTIIHDGDEVEVFGDTGRVVVRALKSRDALS
jgi:phosphohistidine swiveling domain-containing protein